MIQVKTCTRCGEPKHITDFSRHRRSSDGRAWQCKECNSKRAKIWRATPEGIYQNIKGLQNYWKRKPVVISRDDFVNWYKAQPRICAYCDIVEEDLWILGERFHSKPRRLTVDCMTNELGYREGNLVLACERCNIAKNNVFNYEEFREIAQKFLKPKWVEYKATTAKAKTDG